LVAERAWLTEEPGNNVVRQMSGGSVQSQCSASATTSDCHHVVCDAMKEPGKLTPKAQLHAEIETDMSSQRCQITKDNCTKCFWQASHLRSQQEVRLCHGKEIREHGSQTSSCALRRAASGHGAIQLAQQPLSGCTPSVVGVAA
jgi:hypothetical protein